MQIIGSLLKIRRDIENKMSNCFTGTLSYAKVYFTVVYMVNKYTGLGPTCLMLNYFNACRTLGKDLNQGTKTWL